MFDIGNWLKVFDYKNLENFFKSEKGKGGVGEAVGRVVVGYLIYQVPMAIISIIAIMVIGASALTGGYGENGALGPLIGGGIVGGGLMIVVISAIVGLILTPIFFLIGNGVIHLISGLLGGKGEYGNLVYMASFVTAAAFLVSLVLDFVPEVLSLIPGVGGIIGGLLGCLLLPVYLAVSLYFLYATYKLLMVNYGLSSGRAIGVIVLDILFWIVLGVIIFVVLMLIFGASLAALMSQMPTNGYTY